eukprot:Rmarinus@m.7429
MFKEGTPMFVIFVYLVMLSSMFFAASAFLAMDELGDVAPMLRTSWRAQSTTIVLTPFFIHELFWQGSIRQLKNMNWEQKKHVFKWLTLASLGFYFYNFLFSWALDLTSLLNVMLLTNTCPLIVAFSPLVHCQAIDLREGLAAAIGFLGGAMAAYEGAAAGESNPYGDALALAAAFASILFIASIGKLRQELPLFTSMYCFYLALSVMLPGMAIILGRTVLFGTSNESVFGWLGPQHRWTVIYLALFPGLVSQSGMNYSVKFLSTLVMTLMVNTEPVFGTLIALGLGQPTYLGPGTILGGMLLLAAAAYVAMLKKQESSGDAPKHAKADMIDMSSLEREEAGERQTLIVKANKEKKSNKE